MKKRKIIFLAGLLGTMTLLSFSIRRSSSGAPASHTGAPGEKTCAAAGCHDDTRPNIGQAQVSLQFGDNEKDFVPGHTYPVRIRISDPGVTRFGFQLLALENKTMRDQGHFQLTDSARTQLVSNQYELKERKYVTYTFAGTDAVDTGNGEWMVNWTAPADARKDVTFYLATVSGNDDETDKGDKVYTSAYTIKARKTK